MRLTAKVAICAVAVVTAGVGVALATGAIPGSGGVVSGCYGKSDGKLRVVDAEDGATCKNNEVALDWNRVGPAGNDGTSVTSAPLSPGDVNCPAGGSAFTAVSGVTYACNGAKGDAGDKGEKGDTGEPGPPGTAPVYTNYGGPLQTIAEGTTQTVASVTLPTGRYTLMATVAVVSGADGTRFGQCSFAPGTVNGTVALAEVADSSARLPVIGDVTVTTATLPVFLRCTGLDGAIRAAGAIIATRVGTITPSE